MYVCTYVRTYVCMHICTHIQKHGRKLHSIDSCANHHSLWSITTSIQYVCNKLHTLHMYVNGNLFSCHLAMHDLYTVCTYIHMYIHSIVQCSFRCLDSTL